MRNEAADIVQDHLEETKEQAQELKAKARAAGAAAWDATKATYQQLQEKSVEYGRVTDRAIRENPYVSIGVAFGIGLVIGLFVTGGRDRKSD
jgi:ElaB/YqjD/DUF883 family membrane-anchored ribosome-binding protein